MPTEKLMQDLRVVVTDAEDLLKATAQMTGEHLEEVRARAQESLRTARINIRNTAELIDKQASQHPWVAVGLAAGIALAVGILLGRKLPYVR